MSGYRVLAIMAHPDDLEFSCGGTLAKWSEEGADVTVCIVTDGSTGTQDRNLMGPQLAEVRRQEAEAAAKVIGARDVVWMGRRDGYVEYTLDLRREFARLFRKYRPHRFMVMDPASTIEDRFINHPDHRAVGQGSLDVTLSAGTRMENPSRSSPRGPDSTPERTSRRAVLFFSVHLGSGPGRKERVELGSPNFPRYNDHSARPSSHWEGSDLGHRSRGPQGSAGKRRGTSSQGRV